MIIRIFVNIRKFVKKYEVFIQLAKRICPKNSRTQEIGGAFDDAGL